MIGTADHRPQKYCNVCPLGVSVLDGRFQINYIKELIVPQPSLVCQTMIEA